MAEHSRQIPDKRVVFFSPELNGSGAQRVLVNVANGFANRGYPVSVVLMHEGGALQGELDERITVVDLHSNSLTVVPRLMRYFRQHRPTVVWGFYNAFTLFPLLASCLAGTRTRVIPTIHVRVTDILRQSPNSILRLAYRLAIPLWRRTATLVAVSEAVADDLTHYGITRSRIRVIYNPVLTRDFARRRSQVLAAAPVGRKNDEVVPVVLGVGRLDHEKNFGALIEAFSRLPRDVPARLVIVGDGADRPLLESLIAAYGLKSQVSLVGYHACPLAWMQRARVLVISSRYEGFGLVAVEALAVGTPVIAFDDLPVHEIQGCNPALHLVPRDVPEDFVDAIRTVVSTPKPDGRPWYTQLADQFSEASVLALYEILVTDSSDPQATSPKEAVQSS